MAKRRLLALNLYNHHWIEVLMVVGGAVCLGWKSRHEEIFGNGFDDTDSTRADMVKRMTPGDSSHRIGLETTWNEVLIVD